MHHNYDIETILPHKLLSLLIEGTLWNKTIIFEFHTLFIRHEISKTKIHVKSNPAPWSTKYKKLHKLFHM